MFLSENDVKLLAAECQMVYADFVKTYCRWVPAVNGAEQLSLKEKADFDCIFWKGGCSVYTARPLQCRTFPFWPSIMGSAASWKLARSGCQGMDKGALHSMEEIQSCLQKRIAEPVIVRKGQNPEAW